MSRALRAAWWIARATAGTAAAWQVGKGARRLAPVAPVPGAPQGDVSVIIPARDEEHRLGPCLAALTGAGAREVLVVDDGSTDRTAEVARVGGATVVTAGPLPHGWAGKCWALQRGLETATGDWVVCLDADTRPDPGFLAGAIAEARRGRWDLLSLGARFDAETAGERWLHPAMLATLVYRFGPPGTATPPAPGRAMANGQCLIARRGALLAHGGLAPVAGSLVEDVALARHLAGLGWRVGFLDGSRVLEVDMHDSAADTWRAWGRSLPLPGLEPPARAAAGLTVVWLAQALPLARLALRRGDALDAALLAMRLGLLAATAGAYRQRGVPYWLSPLADLPVAARLTAATLRPERTWRGRTY